MNFEIDFSHFQLKQEFFDNDSPVHGINHTYRVMCYVLFIGHAAGLKQDVLLALCAAFMHDFSRKHDGYCNQHGEWAALYKLPEFTPFFAKTGVNQSEIEVIRVAVKNHSELEELTTDHIAYKTTALLKDADALDRIRLNANNLDERYLRFPESSELISFAKQLYFNTRNVKISSFVEILKIAELINQ